MSLFLFPVNSIFKVYSHPTSPSASLHLILVPVISGLRGSSASWQFCLCLSCLQTIPTHRTRRDSIELKSLGILRRLWNHSIAYFSMCKVLWFQGLLPTLLCDFISMTVPSVTWLWPCWLPPASGLQSEFSLRTLILTFSPTCLLLCIFQFSVQTFWGQSSFITQSNTISHLVFQHYLLYLALFLSDSLTLWYIFICFLSPSTERKTPCR